MEYNPLNHISLGITCRIFFKYIIKNLFSQNLYFLPVSRNERLHLLPAHRLVVRLPTGCENLAPFAAKPVGDVRVHAAPEFGLLIGWVPGCPAHQFHYLGCGVETPGVLVLVLQDVIYDGHLIFKQEPQRRLFEGELLTGSLGAPVGERPFFPCRYEFRLPAAVLPLRSGHWFAGWLVLLRLLSHFGDGIPSGRFPGGCPDPFGY